MATSKRKSLSKKIRFEVFKRDSFTCQYCGKSAPDVVLHVDHIIPVAEGGQNEILNLATSCFDCNMGKSYRKLLDSSIVRSQLSQTKKQSERLAQLEMMAVWQKEQVTIEQKELALIQQSINLKLAGSGFSVNESFLQTSLKTALKKYGVNDVLDAVEKSCVQYLKNPKSETDSSKFLNMIERICYWINHEKKDPELHALRRLTFGAKKRWTYCQPNQLLPKIRVLVDDKGFSHQKINELIYASNSEYQFQNLVNEELARG